VLNEQKHEDQQEQKEGKRGTFREHLHNAVGSIGNGPVGTRSHESPSARRWSRRSGITSRGD